MFTVKFKYLDNEVKIDFPCDEAHLMAKLSVLGVGDTLNTRQYVIDTDCDYLRHFETDFVDMDELNFLAKRLDSFIKEEQDIFEALVEVKKAESVAELINYTYNIHNYTLIQDISSMEKIGEKHFKDVHLAWLPEEFEKADFAAIGKELMQSDTGKPTNKGLLFEHDGAVYVKEYNGQNFPEYSSDDCNVIAELSYDGKSEYVYLPAYPLSIDKALKRLGAESADLCEVYLDDVEIGYKAWLEKLIKIAETEDIYAVNKVAGIIHKMTGDEMDKLDAVIEFAGKTDSEAIARLASDLDEFKFYEGVFNEEDLGRALIEENDEYSIHEDIADFFMFEQYAESIMSESDTQFTESGVVILSGKTLSEILDETQENSMEMNL